MVHAFIMVESGPGDSESLLGLIDELPGVTEAHIVAGVYDIVVEMDAEEVYDVLKTVTSDVRSLEGVTRTRTYISLDD